MKAPQNVFFLDNDRERSLLLEFLDLNLTGGGIDSRYNASDCAETASHDFLRGETKWIVSSIAKSTQLIADFQLGKFTGLCVCKPDRIGCVASHFGLVGDGNHDRLRSGHGPIGDRDLLSVWLQCRDHSENSTPAPFEAFGFLLFGQIALGHYDNL